MFHLRYTEKPLGLEGRLFERADAERFVNNEVIRKCGKLPAAHLAQFRTMIFNSKNRIIFVKLT